MKVLLFSSDMATLDEWEKRDDHSHAVCYDLESLHNELDNEPSSIIIADYDTKANEINNWISSNNLPKSIAILESVPQIATGKMLIYRGVKAYGNSRMLKIHYEQMLATLADGNIWTYPELTASLAEKKDTGLNPDSIELINNKLSEKEKETLYLILQGLTNDAIATKMGITTRTVKAHISSIFSKLHVNDRLSLVLLLK